MVYCAYKFLNRLRLKALPRTWSKGFAYVTISKLGIHTVLNRSNSHILPEEDGVHIHLCGQSETTTKEDTKYLGVMIDERLKFKIHLNVTISKTASVNIALKRLIANARPPRESHKRQLVEVVKSVRLYSSPKRSRVMDFQFYRRGLKSPYLLCAISACSCCHTTSENVAVAIAIMTSIDLLTKKKPYEQDLTSKEKHRLREIEW